LTHPDQDHIRGFEELKKRVEIDELWHTPRMFREYEASHELCEDAKVFRKEAQRRREAAIKAQGDPGAGNRVRVFGHSELYEEDKYKNFPKEFREYPGTSTTKINAKDYAGTFEAFIHAPFKDVGEQERNDTSLALQVKLWKGEEAELARCSSVTSAIHPAPHHRQDEGEGPRGGIPRLGRAARAAPLLQERDVLEG